MSENNEADFDGLYANLNAFQRDLLFALEQVGPCKGLAVEEHLEEYYGEELNHARVYTNLNKLIGYSMIFKRQEDGRTNRYDLTSRGEGAIESRRNWQ